MTLRNGKKVIKEKNLYSGYVFIEAILTGEVEYELSNTTNVIDFLRGRRKAAPQSVFANLRYCVCSVRPTKFPEPEADFIVGEQVKVIEGPFKDFHGVIEEVNHEKRKLKVSIKIFDRKTPLELENSQVERE